MRITLFAIAVTFLLGVLWLSTQSMQDHVKARFCDSLTNLPKSQIVSIYGQPNEKVGPATLIGAPSVLSNADEVWIYRFGESTVNVGLKDGKTLGTYSSIKLESYDRAVFWLIGAGRFMSSSPVGNSEKQLLTEFSSHRWSDRGIGAS